MPAPRAARLSYELAPDTGGKTDADARTEGETGRSGATAVGGAGRRTLRERGRGRRHARSG